MALKLFENSVAMNGCFEYWNRGTSFVSPASAYVADRWQYFRNGTATHTVSQSTNVPVGAFGRYSVLIDCTTALPILTAGSNYGIMHKVEGIFFRKLKGKKILVKFSVFATKTGVYSLAFRNASRTRSLVKEYTVTASNTWQEFTVRFTHDETGTWLYDTAIGMEFIWTIACENTYMTAPGIWTNGNFIASPSQVNACDNINNNFYIAEVTIMEDTPDQMRDPKFVLAGRDLAEELQLCKRYYQASNNTPATYNGQASKIWWVPYEVQMRANPVVTVFGQASGTVQPVYQAGVDGFNAYLTSTTTGNANYISYRADAEL
jgi:hypothetical protein